MSRDFDRSDNAFQSGVFGLVLGFLAGAAAVLLSDPDRREKVKEKTSELVDKTKTSVLPAVSKLADTVKEKSDQLQEALSDTVAKAEEKIDQEIQKTENKEV